jgi:osmotically-inducible protein OsmY
MATFKSDLAVELTKRLADDERTEGAAIEVVDDGAGVITLKGAVSSNEISTAAQEIANNEEDVTTVVNDLTVDPDDRTLWVFPSRQRL